VEAQPAGGGEESHSNEIGDIYYYPEPFTVLSEMRLYVYH
jgi:hypothetical protein